MKPKYRLDDLRALVESGAIEIREKKPKRNPKTTPPSRNAEEYRVPQVTRGARNEMKRNVEREALQRIEEKHTTPANNVQFKKAAIFEFKRNSRQGEPNSYECTLPDGYVILVEKRNGLFHAWYAFQGHDKTYPNRRELMGIGTTSYSDAVTNLMGKPQFKNPHSMRWLKFFDLCNPHIIMGGEELPKKYRKTRPSNPGPIPTQARVNALNKAILPDAGVPDEVLLRIRIPEETLRFSEDREPRTMSFYELRTLLEKGSENRI